MAISREELFKLTLSMFSLNNETVAKFHSQNIEEAFKHVQHAYKELVESKENA